MITKVEGKIKQITAQYNLKQQEEKKLEQENENIRDKKAHIEELKDKLARTKEMLQRK